MSAPSGNPAQWYFSGQPASVQLNPRGFSIAADPSPDLLAPPAARAAQAVGAASAAREVGGGGAAVGAGGKRIHLSEGLDGTNARAKQARAGEPESVQAVEAHVTDRSLEKIATQLVRDPALLSGIATAVGATPFDDGKALDAVTDLLYDSLAHPRASTALHPAAVVTRADDEDDDVEDEEDEEEEEVEVDAEEEGSVDGGVLDATEVKSETEVEVPVDEEDEDVSVASLVPRGSGLAVRSAGPFVPAAAPAAPAPAAAAAVLPTSMFASPPAPTGYRLKAPAPYFANTGKKYTNCTDAAFRARARFAWLPADWYLMTATRGQRLHHDVVFVSPNQKYWYWHKHAAVKAIAADRAAMGQ